MMFKVRRVKICAVALFAVTFILILTLNVRSDIDENRRYVSATASTSSFWASTSPSEALATTSEISAASSRLSVEESKRKITDFQEDNVAKKCLMIHCNGGRLGNQMFTYATLYGLSRLNNRTACAPSCILNWFENVFRITTPKNYRINWFEKNAFEIGSILNPNKDSKIPENANIIIGEINPESYTFFDFVRSDIRKEFTFYEHLAEHAQTLLRQVAALKGPRRTFIGVHVRRGDFQYALPFFNTKLAGVDFYKKAMEIFRLRHPKAVFVVVSDDMDWCRVNLVDSDVFIHDLKVSPEQDLALLAHCNHTIFSTSTFGFWGAYLAGGETIYLANATAPGTWSDIHRPEKKYYLPEWKGIADRNASNWEHYNENRVFGDVYQLIKPLMKTIMKYY